MTAGRITDLTRVRSLLFFIANSCLIASVLSCAFLFISNEPEYIYVLYPELQNVTDMTDISVSKYLQTGVKSLGEHVILQNQAFFCV